MDITDCKIHKYEKDNMRGFVSLTFDHCFVVKGFKIMQGKSGLFLAMPSELSKKPKDPAKPYEDTAFPLNKDYRDYMTNYVIAAYNTGVNPNFVSTSNFGDMANHPPLQTDLDEPF